MREPGRHKVLCHLKFAWNAKSYKSLSYLKCWAMRLPTKCGAKNTFLQYDVSSHERIQKKGRKKKPNVQRNTNWKIYPSNTHECGKWSTFLHKTCVRACATFSQANKVSTWNCIFPLLFTFPLRISEKKMANMVGVRFSPFFFVHFSHLHTNEVVKMCDTRNRHQTVNVTAALYLSRAFENGLRHVSGTV